MGEARFGRIRRQSVNPRVRAGQRCRHRSVAGQVHELRRTTSTVVSRLRECCDPADGRDPRPRRTRHGRCRPQPRCREPRRFAFVASEFHDWPRDQQSASSSGQPTDRLYHALPCSCPTAVCFGRRRWRHGAQGGYSGGLLAALHGGRGTPGHLERAEASFNDRQPAYLSLSVQALGIEVVEPASVTHFFDMDQRYIELAWSAVPAPSSASGTSRSRRPATTWNQTAGTCCSCSRARVGSGSSILARSSPTS